MIAFAISCFVAVCAACVWGYVVYLTWLDGTTFSSDVEAVAWGGAGLVACYIGFWILNFILLLFLMPGNNVQDVPSNEDAIRKVSATNMSILGFLSFFFFKLCAKKKEWQQKLVKKEATTAPESSSSANEIDELINTIE